ncbi:hypothetical protein [Streptococcus oralis]|uniref:hypothetical protein n=1 Tax=Streptococcus oralis TaxID=1303 RepID=UPI001CBDB7A6
MFAFTILRSVPNKLFGVILIFGSIFVLLIFIWFSNYQTMLDNILYFLSICFV